MDGHGDVVALLDLSTNAIAESYTYDAFGNLPDDFVSSVDNPILYSGYQYDEETGLYYLNARMYDPEIARFIQMDTYLGNAADPLSLNLYTYCSNNPIRYYDPTGHRQTEDILGEVVLNPSTQSSNLSYGSTGQDVANWQQTLIESGYDVGSAGADGIMGTDTVAATIQYQKDKGLVADGIVGSNTLGMASFLNANNGSLVIDEEIEELVEAKVTYDTQKAIDLQNDIDSMNDLDTSTSNRNKSSYAPNVTQNKDSDSIDESASLFNGVDTIDKTTIDYIEWGTHKDGMPNQIIQPRLNHKLWTKEVFYWDALELETGGAEKQVFFELGLDLHDREINFFGIDMSHVANFGVLEDSGYGDIDSFGLASGISTKASAVELVYTYKIRIDELNISFTMSGDYLSVGGGTVSGVMNEKEDGRLTILEIGGFASALTGAGGDLEIYLKDRDKLSK